MICGPQSKLDTPHGSNHRFFSGFTHRPQIVENLVYGKEFTVDELVQSGSAVSSELISRGRLVLRELNKNGWRALLQEAFGNYNEILCLSIHRNQLMLVHSSAYRGEGVAWIPYENNGFICLGDCGRLDDEIGNPIPVNFKRINGLAVKYLSREFQDFFVPIQRIPGVYKQFSIKLSEAVREIREITSQKVRLRSSTSRSDFSDGNHAVRYWPQRESSIGWNGTFAERVYPNTYRGYDKETKTNIRYPDEIYKLGKVLQGLEEVKWREQFGAAFGDSLVVGQQMVMFVDDEQAFLIRENSAFEVLDDGLVFVGICEYPNFYGLSDEIPNITAVV